MPGVWHGLVRLRNKKRGGKKKKGKRDDVGQHRNQ